MKFLIYLIIVVLTAGVAMGASKIVNPIPNETLQAAIDAELANVPICGNNVCQEGEKLSCHQDCPNDFGDITCAFEGRQCPTSSIMIYFILAIYIISLYDKQRRSQRKNE